MASNTDRKKYANNIGTSGDIYHFSRKKLQEFLLTQNVKCFSIGGYHPLMIEDFMWKPDYTSNPYYKPQKGDIISFSDHNPNINYNINFTSKYKLYYYEIGDIYEIGEEKDLYKISVVDAKMAYTKKLEYNISKEKYEYISDNSLSKTEIKDLCFNSIIVIVCLIFLYIIYQHMITFSL